MWPIEFRRGRAVTVSGSANRSALQRKVNELMQFASRHGYRPEEVLRPSPAS